MTFNSVAVFKTEGEVEPIVYAIGNDKFIKEIQSSGKAISSENKTIKGELTDGYTESMPYSQVIGSTQRKLMFVGLADQSKPGNIQVFRHTFERSAKLKESKDQTNYRFQKLLDVQAHSKAVEKLKLNYDHTRLFSVGADGVVAIYSIHDKENNRKNAFQFPQIQFSEEILIEKKRRDEIQTEIKRLSEDIKQEKSNIDAQT